MNGELKAMSQLHTALVLLCVSGTACGSGDSAREAPTITPLASEVVRLDASASRLLPTVAELCAPAAGLQGEGGAGFVPEETCEGPAPCGTPCSPLRPASDVNADGYACNKIGRCVPIKR